MKTDVKLLEVGMYIFNYTNWGTLNRHQVTRVTPKQAEAQGLTVKRDVIIDKDICGVERLAVKIVGEYGHAFIQTVELLNEWKEQNTIRKAKRLHRDFKIDKITVEQAKQLIEIYESIQPEVINS